MNVLYHAHSGFRYLVLLAGVATLLYALYGTLARRPFDKTMRTLGSVFAGTLHLQLFLGVALLFSGRFGSGVAGHVFLMVFAAAVAQVVPSVTRRRPPERRSHAPFVVSSIVALALVAAGVMALGRPLVG